MSATPGSPAPPRDQKKAAPARLRLGLLALLQILAALAIFIAAAYLALAYPWQRDLTRAKEFTLSPRSHNLLQSNLLQKHPHPITLHAALRKTSPHYSRLNLLLKRYEQAAAGQLLIRLFDPIRDQNHALEISSRYGELLGPRLFLDDLLILDASPPGQSPTPQQLRFLPVESLLHYQTDDKKQRRVVGYRDEVTLSSTLRSLLEGQPRPFYLLTDKSQLALGESDSPARVLAEILARQNLELRPLSLAGLTQIPNDATGVALIAPRYDLEPAQRQLLEDYWQRPQSSLLITLDPGPDLPELFSFLRHNGINPRTDRILKTEHGRTQSAVTALFLPGLQMMEGLGNQSTTFEGRVSSLQVREVPPNLSHSRLSTYPLIEATPGYWGETHFSEPNPTFDEQEDHTSPLALAAAVIRGNPNLEAQDDQTSRLLVLSTSGFLHPERLRQEQLDFLGNAADWLAGTPQLMGIAPQALERRKLNLIGPDVRFFEAVIFRYLPGLFLLLAALVWNLRRH